MLFCDLGKDKAVVVKASRRWIDVLREDLSIVRGMASSDILEEVTVGDFVSFQREKEGLKINNLSQRKNFLCRQLQKRVKRIAANLDHLYVVTAPGVLLNTVFIDRILCAAREQNIQATIILNKYDKIDDDSLEIIQYYQGIDIPVLKTAALTNEMTELIDDLADKTKNIVSFAGVSGVGKSTLLNQLIPDAARETGHISVKTGQGKQTTSQSEAYLYQKSDHNMLIIDLPGIQNFGITHLSHQDITYGMKDIFTLSASCEYTDCGHIREENCAVKEALANKSLSSFRYDSYFAMIEEIQSFRSYIERK